MRVDSFTYQQVESALYEAMRVYIQGGQVVAEREGRACISSEQSCYNLAFTHECLRPLAERGPRAGYRRGQAIAEYHNSQVGSQSRAVMNGKNLSKAMGFVITLPRDYISSVVPELTEEEAEYLTNRIEAEENHQHFRRKEELEQAIADKVRHQWTPEEREKANEFLLAAKGAVLEEMGIAGEDVMFWAIHWDESFPHLHCMALPTVEKVYEEDVYGKHVYKDGHRKLLHRKGEVKKSYSVERFYKPSGPGELPFLQTLHPRMVVRLTEAGFNASGLLTGATQARAFKVASKERSVRELETEQAMELLALRKYKEKAERKLAEMESEFETYQKALQTQLDDLQKERDSLVAEKEELEIELTDTRRKVAKLNKIVQKLKEEIRTLIQKVNNFVPNVVEHFVSLWKKAKSKAEKETLEANARAEAQAQAEKAAEGLKAIAAEAEALVVEDRYKGVDMATFTRTAQKEGFATKQILKAAEAAGQAETLRESPALMAKALESWFNRVEAEAFLKGLSEFEAKQWMKPAERARRALEEVLRGTIDKAEEIEEDRE